MELKKEAVGLQPLPVRGVAPNAAEVCAIRELVGATREGALPPEVRTCYGAVAAQPLRGVRGVLARHQRRGGNALAHLLAHTNSRGL